MHVSEALLRAFRQMPVFKKDERIFPLLESFPKQYLGKDYAGVATNKKGRHIDINTLDSVRSISSCSSRSAKFRCFSKFGSIHILTRFAARRYCYAFVHEELSQELARQPPHEAHGSHAVRFVLEGHWCNVGRCPRVLAQRVCSKVWQLSIREKIRLQH